MPDGISRMENIWFATVIYKNLTLYMYMESSIMEENAKMKQKLPPTSAIKLTICLSFYSPTENKLFQGHFATDTHTHTQLTTVLNCT